MSPVLLDRPPGLAPRQTARSIATRATRATRTTRPDHARPHAMWLAALAITLGCACTDGYPPRLDEPLTPQGMSSTQRLEAMNRLGAEVQRDRRWRYQLASACELTVRISGDRRASHSAPLRGAELLRSYDRERTLYTVSVLPASAQQADAVPVIETRLWTDSVEMLAHLQAQQRDCVNASSEAVAAEDAPAAAS